MLHSTSKSNCPNESDTNFEISIRLERKQSEQKIKHKKNELYGLIHLYNFYNQLMDMDESLHIDDDCHFIQQNTFYFAFQRREIVVDKVFP